MNYQNKLTIVVVTYYKTAKLFNRRLNTIYDSILYNCTIHTNTVTGATMDRKCSSSHLVSRHYVTILSLQGFYILKNCIIEYVPIV